MPDGPDAGPDGTDSIRLWGIGTGRTLRPLWMLVELGLDFVHEKVITRTPDMEGAAFRAVSPRGKIPMLEIDGAVLGESAAISLHLADRFRDRAVFAPDPGTTLRARHDELCWFIMTEMDAILYTIRRHEGLPEIYGASEAACDAARSYFLRSCEELSRRLQDGRSHLLGEDFSVADLLAKTCFDWAVLVCRIPLPDDLETYSAGIAERAGYRVAMQRNFPPEVMATLTGVTSS